jgi:hypothetical protein
MARSLRLSPNTRISRMSELPVCYLALTLSINGSAIDQIIKFIMTFAWISDAQKRSEGFAQFPLVSDRELSAMKTLPGTG